MRDYEDAPYIVIERGSGGGGLGSFVIGALLGAGVALLLAPQSGEETQEDIRTRARQLRNSAEERVREAQRQLENRLEEAREGVHARVEGVRDAVDAGRHAAVEARGELEHRLERSKAAYRAGVEAAKRTAAEDDAAGARNAMPPGPDGQHPEATVVSDSGEVALAEEG